MIKAGKSGAALISDAGEPRSDSIAGREEFQ
jgi:hypothetical protein